MLVRRRYYFWLFKAYLKRWKKTILTSIIIGVSFFFTFIIFINYNVFPFLPNKYEKVGYAGSYTLHTLPDEILKDVSHGLTSINDKGEIKKGIAKSWKISKNGKVYTFDLKENLKLSNGKKFDIREIPYVFKDVERKFIDEDTVEFTLKDPYAPFLSVVGKPIIVKSSGFKEYKISKIEENSGFIKTLTLSSSKSDKKKIIYFYPTQDALKTAFQLGELNIAKNFSAQSNVQKDFKEWKNVKVEKNTDYGSLVSIFFNINDKLLSNKKIRQALAYSLPESFKEGERSFSFIPPHSIYYSESPNEGLLDLELAASLMDSAGVKDPKITLQITNEYLDVAKKVSEGWKKLGVETEIKISNGIPANFQAFLYVMKIPKDPDMYALWHSNQPNNISHFKNVRIDKLLEDGRQTLKQEERVRVYSDLQKYILDEAPAAFLYFPYSYTVYRK